MTDQKEPIEWLNTKPLILFLVGLIIVFSGGAAGMLIYYKVEALELIIITGFNVIAGIVTFVWLLTTKKYKFRIRTRRIEDEVK